MRKNKIFKKPILFYAMLVALFVSMVLVANEYKCGLVVAVFVAMPLMLAFLLSEANL